MNLTAISDYNGVISSYKDCGRLWKGLGMAELGQAALTFKPRFFPLFGAMLELRRLTRDYKKGKVGYDEIYKVYNERVLRKVPYLRAVDRVHSFAEKKVVRDGMYDGELLEAFCHLRRLGARTGILSTGSGEEISKVLQLTDHGRDFEVVKANMLVSTPEEGCRFDLDIYGNKGEKLEEMLRAMNVTGPVAYLGDSEEDLPCYDHDSVKRKLVVASADEKVKQEAAKRGAEVLDASGDFLRAVV